MARRPAVVFLWHLQKKKHPQLLLSMWWSLPQKNLELFNWKLGTKTNETTNSNTRNSNKNEPIRYTKQTHANTKDNKTKRQRKQQNTTTKWTKVCPQRRWDYIWLHIYIYIYASHTNICWIHIWSDIQSQMWCFPRFYSFMCFCLAAFALSFSDSCVLNLCGFSYLCSAYFCTLTLVAVPFAHIKLNKSTEQSGRSMKNIRDIPEPMAGITKGIKTRPWRSQPPGWRHTRRKPARPGVKTSLMFLATRTAWSWW